VPETLGDVVNERRDIKQPMVVKIGDQLAGQWVFLSVFRHGEPPQVTDHHQSMLIYCVRVKQVVLHLANYPPENRQVARQNVQHGHPPQGMGDTARLLQNLNELVSVYRIAPELRVNVTSRMPHGTQSLCGQTM